MKNYSPAELDKTSKFITFGILILFSSMIFFNLAFSCAFYISYILIGVLLICFLIKPIYYMDSKEKIIIKFLFFKKVLYKQNIMEVKSILAKDVNNSLRTFGVGGLFGYNGYFNNKRFGRMIWFTTNRDYFVLITLKDNKKYVISPKNKEDFCKIFST